MFQSLFFWIPPGKSRRAASGGIGSEVSILVLLDTSRKVKPRRRDSRESSSFNPCSSGYLPESLEGLEDRAKLYGFNPCSSGYLPERFRLGFPWALFPTFQSLFFWIPPGKATVQDLARAAFRFQSLFFWIPPGKSRERASPNRAKNVSILVLLDTSRKAKSSASGSASSGGFNPCSSGYLPESRHKLGWLPIATWFQSLFFWIPPGKRPRSRTWPGLHSGFNPCSSGYLPESHRGRHLHEDR